MATEKSSDAAGQQGGGRGRLLTHVLVGAVVAPILTFAVLVAFFGDEASEDQDDTVRPGFTVRNGQIMAPDDRRFVVKGVVIPYGTFAGGDANGLGTRNFLNAPGDFKRLRGLGVNTIKVLVTPKPEDRSQLSRLRTVVSQAREQGLVVEIGAAFTGSTRARNLMRGLAAEYADDPYVWLQPMNEPNCAVSDPAPECFDWVLWQRQQRALIRTIRGQGMSRPWW